MRGIEDNCFPPVISHKFPAPFYIWRCLITQWSTDDGKEMSLFAHIFILPTLMHMSAVSFLCMCIILGARQITTYYKVCINPLF